MEKLRMVIGPLTEEKCYELDLKLIDFLLENGLTLTDFNIQWHSFDEYMKSIFERRDFVSDIDVQFLFTDEQINSNKDHFHDCWENGLSAYKALTFLDIIKI